MQGREQKVFCISRKDNVATALEDIVPGEVVVNGDSSSRKLLCTEAVHAGHKIAIREIQEGEEIIKYAVPIGCALRTIPQGSWVHLQNMKSLYDVRSSTLDIETGAPKDTIYE